MITIDCGPSTPISQLKSILLAVEDVPVEQQRIFFNGKQLADGRTLEESRVHKGSTLRMIPETIKVTIRTPVGNTISQNVDPIAPIRDIKNKLQFWECILPEEQCLRLNGVFLLESLTLSDYTITPMAVIGMERVHPGISTLT
jgi:ubiquitin C